MGNPLDLFENGAFERDREDDPREAERPEQLSREEHKKKHGAGVPYVNKQSCDKCPYLSRSDLPGVEERTDSDGDTLLLCGPCAGMWDTMLYD